MWLLSIFLLRMRVSVRVKEFVFRIKSNVCFDRVFTQNDHNYS